MYFYINVFTKFIKNLQIDKDSGDNLPLFRIN